jgi:hypothetical protein
VQQDKKRLQGHKQQARQYKQRLHEGKKPTFCAHVLTVYT